MHDKLSAEELATVVTEAGYPTTTRQLERWRDGRLLTPSTRGVAADHSTEDVCRCIAIQRSLNEKDDLKHAARVLWATGFDMDRTIWRPAIEKADRLSAPLIRRLARRFDPDLHPEALTPGDWAAEQKGLPGILGKIRRKLPQADEAAAFAGVMLDIAAGDFLGFEHEEADEGGFTTKEVLLRGLGMDRSTKDAVLGQRLRFDDALQSSFANLTIAFEGAPVTEFSDEELCAARDDVRNGLKAAYCTHQAFAWFLGKEAFGFDVTAYLAKTLGLPMIAAFTPAVARLRRVQGAMISGQAIAEMAVRAEAAWIISNYFYETQRDFPEFREICGPDAMKLSIRDSVSHRNFLRSLSAHNFPEPSFSPWALWRSTSQTKKMPPGLLVMSVGALSQIDLASVVQSANAPINP
jgi:hypothetical protein